MDLSFPAGTFDVIVTNMCIHNIYNKEGRKKACAEIGRVLKVGGTAIVCDFRHVREYKDNSTNLACKQTFCPLII
jgi:arsenite methyltransferase